jgi:hypothetical protein
MGLHTESFTIAENDGSVPGITEPRRALGDGVQHWLEVRRRAADDPQDLGRPRLLLQRVGQSLLQSLALDGLPLERLLESLDPGK